MRQRTQNFCLASRASRRRSFPRDMSMYSTNIRFAWSGVSAVQQFLNERKIGNAVYYPVPLHLQPLYASLGHKPGIFHTRSTPRTKCSLFRCSLSCAPNKLRALRNAVSEFVDSLICANSIRSSYSAFHLPK